MEVGFEDMGNLHTEAPCRIEVNPHVTLWVDYRTGLGSTEDVRAMSESLYEELLHNHDYPLFEPLRSDE